MSRNRNHIARIMGGVKEPHPHRERLDNPKGDDVIVPASYYKLPPAGSRRPDRYDLMAQRRAREAREREERKP
jgi:hypothetical protein